MGDNVLDQMEVGQEAIVCAVSTHGSDPDSVLKNDIADLEGCEEGWWIGRYCCSGANWLMRRVVWGIWRGDVLGSHLAMQNEEKR